MDGGRKESVLDLISGVFPLPVEGSAGSSRGPVSCCWGTVSTPMFELDAILSLMERTNVACEVDLLPLGTSCEYKESRWPRVAQFPKAELHISLSIDDGKGSKRGSHSARHVPRRRDIQMPSVTRGDRHQFFAD